MTDISARGFSSLEQFTNAFVARRLEGVPMVSDYDDYATATAKSARIAEITETSREDAFDRWDAHLEYAAETYDRGLGLAWA